MGRSKRQSFRKDQNRIADLARVLGHPARIAIIELLAEKNACVCGAIVNEIPLSQATISQHLAELKRVGLVKGEIDGPRVCYCIDQNAWRDARKLFNRFLSEKKTCC
jgi:ArsR family transcriptional regulator, arsenate/arsenite/antimonite-responsive transcriptional repressor